MSYIYELPDWPNFYWNEKLISERLTEVRYQQGFLIGRMTTLGFPLRTEAILHTLTQDVLKSSEIEGENLDKEQVRSSIARRLGIDIEVSIASSSHVDGVVEMTIDATQNYDRPLTKERLLGWHASLFPTGYNKMYKVKVGAWRDDCGGPMQVISGPIGREKVHFEAPPSERLEDEMNAFIGWFNNDDKTDPVLRACIAHFRFVTIHPFEDGNGRIARALTDMMLARSEKSSHRFYSMSSRIRQERNAYYNVLEASQKGTLDITIPLECFLNWLSSEIDAVEDTLAAVFKKARFWESCANLKINDRQRKVLNKLLDDFEGKLNTSKWAKMAKCSQDTALRDITELIKLGILQKEMAGGRSTSYILLT